MKNKRKSTFSISLFILLILAGCSNKKALEPSFYILMPEAADKQINETVKISKEKIILSPIQIADYLEQPGIVLLSDDHQIEVAHYHRWAEPIDINIYRFILQSLNNPKHNFIKNSTRREDHRKLKISIERFHGTADGKVLFSGAWEIDDQIHFFSYKSELTTAGYPTLVGELSSLLTVLCKDIVKSL